MKGLTFLTRIKGALKLLTIVSMLVSVSLVHAQNMTVESFRALENDLTAITYGTTEVDQNGNVAALIKIVVTGTGFTFDVGSLGIVKTRQMGGEWWVYVPMGVQRITINHPQYGVLRNYYFDIPIEGARTYEMVLDPGVGKFMNITASTAGATVLMDDEVIGTAPLTHHYIIYGEHKFVANIGKMYGEVTATVTENSDMAISIAMEDMSYLYAPVTINVADNAEIWFNGQYQSNGVFTTELKEGTYSVETRKSNCSNAVTVIDVRRGANNVFNVSAPEPFKGSLNLYVPMPKVIITDHTAGGRRLNSGSREILNVGMHYVSFSKKGYITEEREYEILRDVELGDTIRLQHYPFIKKHQFYLGGGATYYNDIYASAVLGFTLFNVNIEMSYNMGLADLGTVSWYNSQDYSLYSQMSYKQNLYGVRLGYQIPLSLRFGLIPQVGFTVAMLDGTCIEGSGLLGNGVGGSFLSVGGKLLFFPFKHISMFVRPEYIVSTGGTDDMYSLIIEKCGKTTGGLSASGGITLIF